MTNISPVLLKSVSDQELVKNTKALVAKEREITTQVLWHLHEIYKRRLFAFYAYPSLFQYAVQELGYSEAAAGRRISAMKLLAELPELESEIESGALSISTLCSVQHFFQKYEKPFSVESKRNLVLSLKNKSRRECDKKLAELNPQHSFPFDQERALTGTHTEIRFVADDELMQKLKWIRDMDSHVLGCNAPYLDLFHRMADIALKKLDPHCVKRPGASKPAA